ncbi:MAG: HEPN domain-containing protein [Gammaproteobacteria bacterium]|nr:MAG: HEPN domain-containing protein [Gammaproteobacteria bacterium]
MADPRLEAARQWLQKAENDLRSARLLAGASPPLNDTAVYHCQQAAEKALKAFLTAYDIPFQKVHVLQVLVEQCMGVDKAFESLLDAADLLTPYAIVFRYPGEVSEPSAEDVREALDSAGAILTKVSQSLPDQ